MNVPPASHGSDDCALLSKRAMAAYLGVTPRTI